MISAGSLRKSSINGCAACPMAGAKGKITHETGEQNGQNDNH
jgi:hypothetical protein